MLKKVNDSVTVLCCPNMPGNEKQKLLVIGKSAKPPCFKWLRMDSLPVQYYFNKNVWMARTIFQECPVSWDTRIKINQEKFFFFTVDNSAAHLM